MHKLNGSLLDNIVQSALAQYTTEVPPASAREKLLTKAATSSISRSAMGSPAIPALVDGLREAKLAPVAATLSWWEIERCQDEHFSSWQTPWSIGGRIGFLGSIDFKRCRLGSVT